MEKGIRNIEKLKQVEKALQDAFKNNQQDILSEVGKKSDDFEIMNNSFYEEAYEFKIANHDFSMGYEEDVQYEKYNDKDLPDFDEEISDMEDVLDIEHKLTDEQTKELRRIFLKSQARFLGNIALSLYERWMKDIEKAFNDIKIEGYEYLGWEEYSINVKVDGEDYRYVAGDDSELTTENKESLTIEELEENQKKEVKN